MVSKESAETDQVPGTEEETAQPVSVDVTFTLSFRCEDGERLREVLFDVFRTRVTPGGDGDGTYWASIELRGDRLSQFPDLLVLLREHGVVVEREDVLRMLFRGCE
ncbi:MAG: hypothetical protein WDZ79_01155 [Candidatus Paceibacterota bacterium]